MRVYFLSALATTMLAFVAAPSLAQGIPRGSYQQTCRGIRSDGVRVSARCQRADGNWNDTSIAFRNCNGDIMNDNGNLRCGVQRGFDNRGGYAYAGPGYGHWDGGLPPGDYKRTCRNIYMQGDKLSGTCQRPDGGWNNTSLKSVNLCRSRIVNENGNLNCMR
jgi:hypothetical protein